MDYVENCGYNNFSLLRVMAESTPQHMWVMWVYIV